METLVLQSSVVPLNNGNGKNQVQVETKTKNKYTCMHV